MEGEYSHRMGSRKGSVGRWRVLHQVEQRLVRSEACVSKSPVKDMVLWDWACSSQAWCRRAGWASTWVKELRPISLLSTQGLAELHRLGIVHGDLKPENVLLGSRVMLTDFGCSGWEGGGVGIHRPRGTPAFLAPELACAEAGPWWACVVGSVCMWEEGCRAGCQNEWEGTLCDAHNGAPE